MDTSFASFMKAIKLPPTQVVPSQRHGRYYEKVIPFGRDDLNTIAAFYAARKDITEIAAIKREAEKSKDSLPDFDFPEIPENPMLAKLYSRAEIKRDGSFVEKRCEERPFAAELHTAISLLEDSLCKDNGLKEDYGESTDFIADNIRAITSFLGKYKYNYSDAADLFLQFQNEFLNIDGLLPLPRPYDTDSNCYYIDNLFQFCIVELDYMTRQKIRINKCKRCGKYYAVLKGQRNSAYCRFDDCTYTDNGNQTLHKKICNMLRERSNTELEKFINEANAHKKRVKEGTELDCEYRAWLLMQKEALTIRPRKTDT